ncbi:MAG: hypothetical protein ACJA0E_000099 [Bermanella sp.]|jgi:hypothetical protein
MKKHVLTISALVLAMASAGTFAKVTMQEAAKLGNELTPMGAIAAGNKTGTIPAYKGGIAADPTADPFTNPVAKKFIGEAPLFTITAKNIDQYKASLSDGQIAMFNKYPETFVMPVYKTERTAVYPKGIQDKAKKNATATELVDGGSGLKNFDEAFPFVIPQNGMQVIWNHVTRFKGGSIERNAAQFNVQSNGSFIPVKITAILTFPNYLADGYDSEKDANILFYFTQQVKEPARLSGNVLLLHETIDQIKQPRLAWSYNAGQRRVRRAPQVSYDAPALASGGSRTSDQVDMYNGAPDKYDWKLVGKKEMYIPYNAYKLSDTNLKYSDIIKEGHINQSYARYELHRVWHVEATLKDGERHIYGKRTFYMDEDTWQVAVAEQYDTRGKLWRLGEGHAIQFINANTPWYGTILNYDLQAGRYFVELNNEEVDPFVFGKEIAHKNFTPSALRRQGIK